MGLLSQEAKDAFANRQANTSSGASRYLKAKEISEEGTLITFLGNENHTITGFQAFLEKSDRSGWVKINTPEQLSLSELKERAKEYGAVEPTEKQKQFYAFTIYNYAEEAVQIFEFTQAGLITGICDFLTDPDVEGHEEEYDFKLKRVKTGKEARDVRYSCFPISSGKRKQPGIKKTIDAAFKEVEDSGYDIQELFNPEGNPFANPLN